MGAVSNRVIRLVELPLGRLLGGEGTGPGGV